MQLNKNLSSLPEYYNEDLEIDLDQEALRVVIAAQNSRSVGPVLHSWSVITLKEFDIIGI